MLIDRYARPLIVEALSYSRVVLVLGARQVGKSTLAKQIVNSDHPATVLTLDDRATREAARLDPHGFIAGLRGPVLIDEVQLAPDLLYAIKQAVDEDPTPGRFLLTGSANVLTAPTISESLAGRVRRIELWPLSQSEIHKTTGNFVERLFAGDPPQVTDAPVGREAFAEVVARGGYPAVYTLSERQRQLSHRDYVQSIVERDLRDIASAQKLSEIPTLLALLATNSAKLLDYRKLSSDLQISDKTVRAYVELLPRRRRRDRHRPRSPVRRARRDRGQDECIYPRARLACHREATRQPPRPVQGRRHPLYGPPDHPPRRPHMGRPHQRTLELTTRADGAIALKSG
jgi:uncharacterized protein